MEKCQCMVDDLARGMRVKVMVWLTEIACYREVSVLVYGRWPGQRGWEWKWRCDSLSVCSPGGAAPAGDGEGGQEWHGGTAWQEALRREIHLWGVCGGNRWGGTWWTHMWWGVGGICVAAEIAGRSAYEDFVEEQVSTMRVCVCAEWGGCRWRNTWWGFASVWLGWLLDLWSVCGGNWTIPTLQEKYSWQFPSSIYMAWTVFSFVILTSPLTPALSLSLCLLFLCACLPVSLPLPPSSNSPVCFVIFSFSVSLSLSHFPPLFGRLHGRGHNTTQRSAELEQGERGRGHHWRGAHRQRESSFLDIDHISACVYVSGHVRRTL